MTASKTEFKRRLDRALGSDRLRTALRRALPELGQRRDARIREIDWVGLRADLTLRKANAIDDLPALIERFTTEAEAVGAKVYRAVDAEEARRIVTAICRAKKAKLVVKSKSMATEEIGLTDHLESQGIHAVETDLGEWIIQLAGDRPSHLIAPAIHITREEVAKLFAKVVGHPVADDTASLVAVARKELRQSFIDADVGITGGNALIAETGTLMLITNEGNADLATTLPSVHIAVVGIEKIVPTIDDAIAIVKLLARSGTGQKITSYTQFITGPSRSADIELKSQIGVHGPKELHFVLLDNGRTAMRDDPFFRDALRCIRCGACSNVCPSYLEVGGHVFGHIYTGPIGLVVSPWHHGIDSVAHEQALCMGCNACDTVCPVSIPLASLITDVRAKASERTGMSWAKRLFLRQWSTPERIDRLTGWLATFQNPLRRNGNVRLPFGTLAQEKSLPAVADRPLHYRAREITQTNPKSPSLTVAMFPSCLVDHFLPGAGYAAARVLQTMGAEVHVVEGRRCCGLPQMNSGDRPTAVAMAKAAIESLERVKADRIVIPSSSCAITISQDYPRALAGEPVPTGPGAPAPWAERARKLGERITAFTPFAASLARQRPVRGHRLSLRATYHDACQSANVLGIHQDPRTLLRDVAGVELVEMAESAVCCGFGGSFSFEYPEVANRVLERKLANIEATGVDCVIADNPGCLTHLRGAMDARDKTTRVRHLAEVLWESLSS
ncbi:MAG TPA: LUD domain-containing protein [Candidatus Limnocylindria bacterium]|jgi:iron-sulfur cluster protein|nr:LUD domain-containing protein [Candidatus Limnocylindria bacterium]